MLFFVESYKAWFHQKQNVYALVKTHLRQNDGAVAACKSAYGSLAHDHPLSHGLKYKIKKELEQKLIHRISLYAALKHWLPANIIINYITYAVLLIALKHDYSYAC